MNRYERMLAECRDPDGVIADFVQNNVRQYGDFVVSAWRNVLNDPAWTLRAEPADRLSAFSTIVADGSDFSAMEAIELHKDELIGALQRRMGA